MEPEIRKHIRIAPPIQIFGLLQAQSRSDSTVPLLPGRRSAKMIKGFDTCSRQSIQCCAGDFRYQSDERAKLTHSQSADLDRQISPSERAAGIFQCLLVTAICQTKWRLERCMKAVNTRLADDRRPFLQFDSVRKCDITSGVAIVAKYGCAEAVQC